MEVVGHAVLLAVLIGAFVEWIRSPAALPEESWVQRLVVLVPLSVIAGTVLAVAASLG